MHPTLKSERSDGHMAQIPGKVYHGILEDRTGRRKCAIKKLKKEDQIEEKKLLQEVSTQKFPLINQKLFLNHLNA